MLKIPGNVKLLKLPVDIIKVVESNVKETTPGWCVDLAMPIVQLFSSQDQFRIPLLILTVQIQSVQT